MNKKKKIKWGIAGLGNIARRFALDLVSDSAHGELAAVASRDARKSKAFAERFGAAVHYSDYQSLAQDPMVEVVYVATVHPFHKPLVELFLNHGKHVLVEKPAFTNKQDWLAMSDLATSKGLLLAEAMKTVTFPAYRKLKRFLLDHNAIVTHLEAGFGSKHPFDPTSFVFKPELCGGATLDIGVYGLWLYHDLCQTLGHCPTLISSAMKTVNVQSQVDEDVVFDFSGPFSARIEASLVRDIPKFARLTGPNLVIQIEGKWWNPTHIFIHYHNVETEIIESAGGGGFEHEIDHISQCILEGKKGSPWLKLETTGRVIALMEQQLHQHGYGDLTGTTHSDNEEFTPTA